MRIKLEYSFVLLLLQTLAALVWKHSVTSAWQATSPRRPLKSLLEFILSIDITNGYSELSAPETSQSVDSSQLSTGGDSNGSGGGINSGVVEATVVGGVSSTLFARVTRLGQTAVKRVPDNVLLGVLVLIATELIKREVVQKATYPTAMRRVAETAIAELELKFEYLSSTNWNMDPFIQREFERLQAEPLEVLDRYLVTEILPNVDKELSPYLTRLTGDPATVTLFVQNTKEVVQLISFLLTRLDLSPASPESPLSLQRTTGEVMRQIDEVGERVENVVRDWNTVLVRVQELVRAPSVVARVFPRNLLSDLLLKKAVPTTKEGTTFANRSAATGKWPPTGSSSKK